MATTNDITGDAIRSKKPSDAFDKGFGEIDWSVKLGDDVVSTDEPVVTTEDWESPPHGAGSPKVTGAGY